MGSRHILAAAIGLSASGCVPSPFPDHAPVGCFTPCGTFLMEGGDCTDLAAYETVVLNAYATHVNGFSVDVGCRALKGFEIHVIAGPRPGKFFSGGKEVYGTTLLSAKKIFLGSNRWPRSALAHEIGHVLDRVMGILESHKHPQWTSRGLCAAIKESSLLEEYCELYD